MKQTISVFLLILGLMVMHCQSSHEEGHSYQASISVDSPLSHSQWQHLAQLQKQIQHHPENAGLINKYLALSVDTRRNLIYTVGFSTVNLSTLNGALQYKTGQQAALFKAQEWASYIRQWLPSNPSKRQYGKLKTFVKDKIYYKAAYLSRDTVYINVAFSLDAENR